MPAMITIEKAFQIEPYRSIINILDAFPDGLERKHLCYELTDEMENKKGEVAKNKDGTKHYKIRNEKTIIEYLEKNKLFDYNDKINKKCLSRNLLSKYLQRLVKLGIINKKAIEKGKEKLTKKNGKLVTEEKIIRRNKYYISDKCNEFLPVFKNLELLEKQKDAIISEFLTNDTDKKTYLPIFCEKEMVIFSMQPYANYEFRQLDMTNKKLSQKFEKIKRQLLEALYSIEEIGSEIFDYVDLDLPQYYEDFNISIILNTKIKNKGTKILFSKHPTFFKS